MDNSLHRKLDPGRYRNMSEQQAAVMGCDLEGQYTTASLADINVTPDTHALAWPA